MATQPDQQQQVLLVSTPKVLSAGVAQMVLPANRGRRYLMLQNVGVNPATIGLDGAPTAAQGIGLDAASAAGGQGGSWEFREIIPTNAIWAISAAGTTVIGVEG